MEVGLEQKKVSNQFETNFNKRKVSFRHLVSIPSTLYATHGIYKYPAKFIPHVVRFVIEKYSTKKDWFFDPFAGSGTVAIEAHLLNRNYLLWDINPMTELITRASTYIGEIEKEKVKVNFSYKNEFIPKWSNLKYWFPQEFIDVLSKAWGYWHNEIDEKYKPIAAIPLLKATRYFSYSDEKISKLYKSKHAKKKVQEILNKGPEWKKILQEYYNKELENTIKKIREFNEYKPYKVQGIIRAPIDSLNAKPETEVNLLITSPPYLQSQEYIRSVKLELFWLGYSEDEIKKLSKKEIPYNNPPDIKIESNLYYSYLEKVRELEHEGLLRIYTSYFKSILYIFTNVSHQVKNVMAIFVGPAKIRTMKIPIDDIIKEHLECLGWKHEVTFVDKIVSRRLFLQKINPATGLVEERTPTEHLIILKNVK